MKEQTEVRLLEPKKSVTGESFQIAAQEAVQGVEFALPQVRPVADVVELSLAGLKLHCRNWGFVCAQCRRPPNDRIQLDLTRIVAFCDGCCVH